MLTRRNRLNATRDIQHVLKNGRRVSTEHISVHYLAGQFEQTRIATVVSKKVHASAVRRHQLQRWLRALAQRYIQSHQPGVSYDMVWVARPKLRDLRTQAELVEELETLLNTIKTKAV